MFAGPSAHQGRSSTFPVYPTPPRSRKSSTRPKGRPPAPQTPQGRSGQPRSRRWNPGDGSPNSRIRDPFLAGIAQENLRLIPKLLASMGGFNGTNAEAYWHKYLNRLHKLQPKPVKIKVVNADTIDTAIRLYDPRRPTSRVAVLNMANDKTPGGGWLDGTSAQEEILCYRTTLSASLHKKFYNFYPRQVLYSPDVAVMRGNKASGYRLWHNLDNPGRRRNLIRTVKPEHRISVISVAAFRDPPKTGPDNDPGKQRFANLRTRQVMIQKMCLALRVVLGRKHDVLVLGALGCGAFRNPVGDVADCWLEALGKEEFRGRFHQVYFAVLDSTKPDSNYSIFKRKLDGKLVG